LLFEFQIAIYRPILTQFPHMRLEDAVRKLPVALGHLFTCCQLCLFTQSTSCARANSIL